MRIVIAIAIVVASASCGTGVASHPPVVQPGAPGQPSRAGGAGAPSTPAFTDADVRFMQGMIHHHAQALEMTSLLETRTGREEMKLLAKRIDVSQTDEITMMQRWLRERGKDVPDPLAHSSHDMSSMPGMTMTMDAPLMPGMLTPDEMARLASAKGAEFDRLFLEFMIKHHEGALVMVKELFASPASGQSAEIFAFASDVEADQRAEINRMRRMRAEMDR